VTAPRDLRPATFPVIFAAPSGAGKTSIARALGTRRGDVSFSVSATTRQPRSYEIDGRDYHFRSEEQFKRLIDAGDLLEWACVHGCYYGTPLRNVDEARESERFLILDIDVQGSRQVKRALPGAVSIFVLPPSGPELARRLAGRGSEDATRRERRLRAARDEIAAAAEFDYVVINESLDQSVNAVDAILSAESHRASRMVSLPDAVDRLCAEVDEFLSNESPHIGEQ
jgi:guanylate kinase